MSDFKSGASEISKSVEVLDYSISAELYAVGEDRLVLVRGGSRHHIGSVSTARFENGAAQLEKILLPAHRDDVVGDAFAVALCEKLRANVCVVCGIHYDISDRGDIDKIVSAAKTLLEKLLTALS